jgi:dTDP-4-amino-4,6-dideoxygalactose transaminase
VNRNQFIDQMRAERIQTSIHYPPTHTFTYYMSKYGRITLAKTEDAAAREVTLPLYPGMGEENVRLVVQTVMDALAVAQTH